MALTWSSWRQLLHGARTLLNRQAADRDVHDEVQHYLEQAIDAHRARGLSPDDARRAAQLELGNLTVVREEVRSYGWEQVVGAFASDVRYAQRMLRKSPVFTLVVVLVVALGSGAVTTIASGINALLLRPLPGTTDGRRLVSIDRKHENGREGISASYGYYQLLRDRTRTLSGIGAWSNTALTISTGDGGVAAFGNLVSGNYFTVLGVRPLLGRFFLPDEDRTPLTHPVIVLSELFWRTQFTGDSGIVGRQLQVNGHSYTVIGIAPQRFRGVFTPLKVDAWVPLMMQPQLRPERDLKDASALWLRTFGRLRDGVSDKAARAELSAITADRAHDGTEPDFARTYTVARTYALTGLPDDASGALIGFVSVLFAASALVLLIACVNVASLLSARAIARRREMAVRAALGAARSRLIRQLLTETLLLFSLGALGGMLVAVAATRALERVPLPEEISLELSPDFRVLGFALLLSLGTGVLFGLAPALKAVRHDIVARLRADTAGSGVRRSLLGRGLLVGQLALSLVLLVSAGLFLRTLNRAEQVNPGFEAAGVSAATFNTEGWGYDDAKGRAFYQQLRERLEQRPGVAAVTFTGNVPLAYETSDGFIAINGDGGSARDRGKDQPSDQPRLTVQLTFIGANYFKVLRLPIVRGRPIDATDHATSARVAVVNETLAHRLSTDGDVVGRQFGYHGSRVLVVGVARDSKYESMAETTPNFVYFPMAQQWAPKQTLLVRSDAGAEPLAVSLRRILRTIDPGVPMPVVTTLQQRNDVALLPQRVAAMVTGALGTVGLLLATLGLYGTMAYSANRRTREIGIRAALGARRVDLLRLLVGEGLQLAGLGAAIGLVFALASTRLLRPYLMQVSPFDPLTFVAMSCLFTLIAAIASYLPARRAAALDPMVALRTD